MSLALLLGPQLRAFAEAGYEVIGASAHGPHVEELTSWGIRHEAVENATRAMAPQRDAKALVELRSLFRGSAPISSTPTTPSRACTVASRLAWRAFPRW
jgi:hypothetical protein